MQRVSLPSSRPDLVHSSDDRPGIRRQRRGRGYSYIAPDGTRIDAPSERARINALAIPPAYEDVWICPETNGHLQATGRDARRRKQYRYHPEWTAYRALQKFAHLGEFGAMLPRIRRAILKDLKTDAGGRRFAIAAVLALIDRASMRVGHADYTRDNQTFGATTLEDRHVSLNGAQIELKYTAKGGQKVHKTLRDATLNRTLARLHDLPGAELMSWSDNRGNSYQVSSDAVNERLFQMTGNEDMTAKAFRTWNGSAAAVQVLARPGTHTIRALAEAAAERLHNSPTIARNSYIHPAVIDLLDVPEPERAASLTPERSVSGLKQSENQLLHLLNS